VATKKSTTKKKTAAQKTANKKTTAKAARPAVKKKTTAEKATPKKKTAHPKENSKKPVKKTATKAVKTVAKDLKKAAPAQKKSTPAKTKAAAAKKKAVTPKTPVKTAASPVKKKSAAKKATPKAAKPSRAAAKKNIAVETPPEPSTPEAKAVKTPVAPDPALLKIRDRLLQNRDELMSMIESFRAQERSIGELNFSNEIDLASSLEGREMIFQLSSRDRNELKLIEEALYKIKEGSYGVCDSCAKRISMKRLQILPLTSLCIECQENLEHS